MAEQLNLPTHPDLDKPIRSLECCCCGGGTRGRQWWNRDTGYGLCESCIDYCARGTSAEDFASYYGVRGVHFDVQRAQPPAPLTLDTIFAYLNDRRSRPYERLRVVAEDPIPEVEVTEEVYEHFLNILPPVLLRGGGFYVIERVTDNTVSSYFKRGDQFFHRYIDARTAAR